MPKYRLVLLDGDDNETLPAFAFEGMDFIIGFAGDDIIRGGNDDDRLFGLKGNDIISGGDDADYIAGGKGDDILIGVAGDDRIDGGQGFDRAVYLEDISNYEISTLPGNKLVITDIGSGYEGTDIVTKVEEFNFGGTIYSYDDLLALI